MENNDGSLNCHVIHATLETIGPHLTHKPLLSGTYPCYATMTDNTLPTNIGNKPGQHVRAHYFTHYYVFIYYLLGRRENGTVYLEYDGRL